MRLIRLSTQSWLPGCSRNEFRAFSGGTREWLFAGDWSISDITKKRAEIHLHRVDSIIDASVFDAIKYSSAAFESARAAACYKNEPKSCAWQFIAYYYAAYFAANALMRLSGYACINLSASECAEINEQALLYGIGTADKKLSTGVYRCVIDVSGTPSWSLAIVKTPGGVHMQFWNGFMAFLEHVKRNLQVSTTATAIDRDSALLELNQIITGLQFSGSHSGGWLSEVRNAVNYRLEYGAWFPYSNSVTDGHVLKDYFNQSLNLKIPFPNLSQDIADPLRATRVCGYLLGWLKGALEILHNTSGGKKKSLIGSGPLAIAASIT